MTLQEQINNTYPPTHVFDAETLTPKGPLADRLALIEKRFDMFFKGGRFLDVGSNKGFFSAVWKGRFDSVDMIEPDKELAEISEQVVSEASLFKGGFRDFSSSRQFRSIFIGNGPHHLYREIKGHEWIAKVYALLEEGGYVLIEGPFSKKDCSDLRQSMFDGFENGYLATLNKYFTKEKNLPTVSYTPGRCLTLWKKEPYIMNSNNVFHKKFRTDDYVDNNRVSIEIASTSPISNGLTGFSETGWYEKYDGTPPYKYFENELPLFKLHCKHQQHLLRMGYWDLDSATINFWKGKNTMFDKSAVIPVSDITELHISGYEKLLLQSYRQIPKTALKRLTEAHRTKDSKTMERAYQWVESQL